MQENKSISEIAITGILGALLAGCFNIVRISRTIHGENFNFKKFLVGTTSAGAVGCISAWILDDLGFSTQTSAAIIAILGYVGGPLLDLLYDEVGETAKIFIDKFQEKLKK